MSIASEITRLQTAKDNIKSAIETKGVTVPSNASIDTYYDYIDQIEVGEGGIEIFPNPAYPYQYGYTDTKYSSSTVVTKSKRTFDGGLDLPIKWVKDYDGNELSNGTYTLYNPAGQFTSAQFTISGSDPDKVLTFNYFSDSDKGLPMCIISNPGTHYGKRIYICIDESRANFCTYKSGGAYIYSYTNNGSMSYTTINGSTTSGNWIVYENLDTRPDPTAFYGYLLNNVYTFETSSGLVLFSFVVIG